MEFKNEFGDHTDLGSSPVLHACFLSVTWANYVTPLSLSLFLWRTEVPGCCEDGGRQACPGLWGAVCRARRVLSTPGAWTAGTGSCLCTRGHWMARLPPAHATRQAEASLTSVLLGDGCAEGCVPTTRVRRAGCVQRRDSGWSRGASAYNTSWQP